MLLECEKCNKRQYEGRTAQYLLLKAPPASGKSRAYLFLGQKRKLGLVKRIQKQIIKFGLTKDDLEIVGS